MFNWKVHFAILGDAAVDLVPFPTQFFSDIPVEASIIADAYGRAVQQETETECQMGKLENKEEKQKSKLLDMEENLDNQVVKNMEKKFEKKLQIMDEKLENLGEKLETILERLLEK